MSLVNAAKQAWVNYQIEAEEVERAYHEKTRLSAVALMEQLAQTCLKNWAMDTVPDPIFVAYDTPDEELLRVSFDVDGLQFRGESGERKHLYWLHQGFEREVTSLADLGRHLEEFGLS